MDKPFSVYDIETGRILDQSATKERASDRLWEIKTESEYKGKLDITNKANWNDRLFLE